MLSAEGKMFALVILARLRPQTFSAKLAEDQNQAFAFSYTALSAGQLPRDAHQIDALNQWCLHKLLGIKWCHSVRNDEERRTTKQPHLSSIAQAWRFSLFGHIARLPDETGTKKILTTSPLLN